MIYDLPVHIGYNMTEEDVLSRFDTLLTKLDDTLHFQPSRSWYFWYFSVLIFKILTLLILFSSYHQDSGREAPEGGEPDLLRPGLHHQAEVHGGEHHHRHLDHDHHDGHKYQVENIVGEQPEYIIWKKGNRMLNYDTERGGIRCLALASNLSQHKLSFLGFVFVLISCSRVSLTLSWHLVPACLCLCLDILFQTVFNFVLIYLVPACEQTY